MNIATNWQYIDTHAHLNLSAFKNDVDAVATRCQEEGVAVINIGTKLSTSQQAVELAEQYEHCYAMVGLHPIQTTPGHHDEEEVGEGAQPFTSKGEVFVSDEFRALAKQSNKVIGIGECGFDYFHNTADTYEVQEVAFIEQVKLANELQLPIMIHTREPKPGEASPTGRSAYDDVYDILKNYATVPGNIHFFAGNYEQAKRFIDLGFTVSFTGVITFAKVYEEVVRAVPLESMHAETDCPYVAPVPYRGQRAEPWQVVEVVKLIAMLKDLDEATVAAQLRFNAEQLYGVNLTR